MAEERLDSLLRVLEQPVRPDDAFAERLYARLVADLGLSGRAGTRAARRAFDMSALFGPLRIAWVVLVVALTALVLGALVIVGGAVRSADATVERSQSVFWDPPPVDMTTRFADASEVRYRYDGDTLRLDVVKGRFGDLPEGYYTVKDGERIGVYDAGSNEWFVSDDPSGYALGQWNPSWIAPVAFGPGEQPPLVTCRDWRLAGEAEIAGRTADEVRCGSEAFWVDRDSGLLVKRISSDPASPSSEVVALTLEPALDTAVFAFEPPPGAADANAPPSLRPASSVLQVGEPAPSWTGPLIDGEPFSTDSLEGRPLAVYFWCSCEVGREAQLFLAEARARRGDLGLVFVSLDERGTTEGLVEWLAADTPVVHDGDWDFLTAWGLEPFSALVLVRPDGTVADIHPGRFSAEKLSAVLDALAAGETIPEPDPRPARVVDENGDPPMTTVLEVGTVAPEVAGPRLGGGELSTADLRGKPTVVLHWVPPDIDGSPLDDAPPADAVVREAEVRQSRVNVLLVAHGERTRGSVEAYLERQGADVPVIFDWDGALFQRWGLVYLPTLVLLDADGVVQGYYGYDAVRDPAELLDALEAGEPLPSPSLGSLGGG